VNVDLDKIARIVTQASSIANVGAAGAQALVGAVIQIAAILRQRGYDVDTDALDRLMTDAERRRQIAIAEAQAES
jgi:hypothetical protein